MLRTDLVDCNIHDFTWEEVAGTGADPKDVDVETIIRLQRVRTEYRKPIDLLYNGLTTGTHASPEHSEGRAVDCYPRQNSNRYFNFKGFIYIAIDKGFTGIGVYYCKQTGLYTFHLDTGPRIRRWSGYKNLRTDPWFMRSLYYDPKDYKTGF